MARIRTDNVFGTTTNAPLLVGGTTLNSAGLANLAVVAGADRAVIILDPNRVNGAPEIVYVTAHTGGATSATILRGQEGTAAREHPLGTFWVHAWTAADAGLGVLGYAEVVASQGTITAEVDLTGLTTTVTVLANRRIRITASLEVESSVANDLAEMRIKESTTQLQRARLICDTANQGQTIQRSVVLTPTAASHTYKVTALRASGTGNIQSTAAATLPAWILVEDIGPA